MTLPGNFCLCMENFHFILTSNQYLVLGGNAGNVAIIHGNFAANSYLIAWKSVFFLALSTIELCDATAMFGILFGDKHQNLTRLNCFMVNLVSML